MVRAQILVTGAPGGTQGATARIIVEQLTRRGVAVAAMVRKPDHRSVELAAMGAEIVYGDMLTLTDVTSAVRERKAVYFCYPVRPGLLEASAIMAHAAREAKIGIVVNLSQGSAATWSPSPTGRKHWLSEQILKAARIPVYNLRGAVFYENLFRQFAAGIAEASELRAPFGDGRSYVPMIAAADVANIAVDALLRPQAYAGKTRFAVAELLSLHEIAALLSVSTSRKLRYREVTDESWLSEARTREDASNLEQLEHLVMLWRHLLAGNRSGFLPSVRAILRVRNLVGTRKFLKFEDWLNQRSIHCSSAPQQSVAPREPGTLGLA